jgi:peptide/nickel transport system permease protein
MIFPALALGYHNTAFTARITRSSMLEVMREDYIRTARSKGLGELIVLFRHALKNAFMPVITVSGWQFSRLLGGAVLIEIIFLIPGIGQLMVDSVSKRDFNIIQAVILLAAVSVLTLNLVVDLAYAWLNPRVRYS